MRALTMIVAMSMGLGCSPRDPAGEGEGEGEGEVAGEGEGEGAESFACSSPSDCDVRWLMGADARTCTTTDDCLADVNGGECVPSADGNHVCLTGATQGDPKCFAVDWAEVHVHDDNGADWNFCVPPHIECDGRCKCTAPSDCHEDGFPDSQ